MSASTRVSPGASGWFRRPQSAKLRDHHGFTLIELLIVIIILGILIAVAIPIFIRQTNLAKETSAQSMLSGMGQIAYIGINEDLNQSDLKTEVQDGTRSGIAISYSGRTSEGPKDVVAQTAADDKPGQWLAAVQPRSGRCTLVNVTDGAGIIASRTVDTGNSPCRADLGLSITLTAADFQSAVRQTNGQCRPAPRSCTTAVLWDGTTMTMPDYGMLLSPTDGTKLTTGSLSANVTLPIGSNGIGLVFKGSQGPGGQLNGYTYQFDPGYQSAGPNGALLIRKWTNGSESNPPVWTTPIPAGTNVRATQNMQIDLLDNNTAIIRLNGQQYGTPFTLDPSVTGTGYGVRTWQDVNNKIADIKITPTPNP